MLSPRPPMRRIISTLITVSLVVLAVATSAGAQTEPPPTGTVQAAADPVAGQYVVTLRDHDPVDSESTAQRLVDTYGGTILNVYTSALAGFAVRMAPDDAARLAADEDVESVQEDGVVTTADVQPPSPATT